MNPAAVNSTDQSQAIDASLQHAVEAGLADLFDADPSEWKRVPGFLVEINCLGQARRITAKGVPVKGGELARHRTDGTIWVTSVSGDWFKVSAIALLVMAFGKHWPDVQRLATTKRPKRQVTAMGTGTTE